MKIAVASEGLDVSSYFECCTNYNCFTVENGSIIDCRNLLNPTPQDRPSAAVLSELGIDTVIVGDIDRGSISLFADHNLAVFSGATGSAKEAVSAYITSTYIACDEFCDE